MIARICALLKTVTGEQAWKSIVDRLQGPRHLNRNDHDRKIRTRKKRIEIDKYSFLNRTIKLWKQMPAKVLGIFLFKPHSFRKRFRKVFINNVNLNG
jgi:hypothetical protein